MITQTICRMKENIQRVIVGKDETLDMILVALLCQGHVLIEDVPGTGKTTLAKSIARSLGCTFRRIQFTPDLLPSDVTGVRYFDRKSQTFVFRPGPVVSHVVLADEINRATPRTQSALLEAMQERQITVDGETRRLPSPFIVLATQNPIELEGTFPLPEAQVDRFMICIGLGYPGEQDEHRVLTRFERSDPLETLEPVTSPEELIRMQQTVRDVRVEESVRDYAVRLVRATRDHPAVEIGVSPRGSLALYHTCQAWAAIQGRDFVLPDDVKAMAPPVLTHRIAVNPQSRLHGATAAELVRSVVATVRAPVEQL
ncbi:MAG: MoxR family ATPase [Anaerolineae bacterium]|jgi:MoxR-like ATPase